IPDSVEYSFFNFKNFKSNHEFDEFDSLILTGSSLSAFSFQEMLKKNIFEYENYFHLHKTFKKLLDYKKPMFGICFGAQILALLKGGKIGHLEQTEFGYLEHKLTEDGKVDLVFGYLSETFFGAHSHDDHVQQLPQSPEVQSSSIIATHDNYIHAYKIECVNDVVCYGVQPHPEMSLPDKATFMITESEDEIKNKIGEDEYKKNASIPENATFELPEVISKFINLLTQKAQEAQ
ncbi:gamma-glutamyl-gamma-aminobutyrate hydrolase family protein, partial [bacterium]|nr:gamma-glutamyl-gamma-aminobutyrate hydrolase family protein [bacterium]